MPVSAWAAALMLWGPVGWQGIVQGHAAYGDADAWGEKWGAVDVCVADMHVGYANTQHTLRAVGCWWAQLWGHSAGCRWQRRFAPGGSQDCCTGAIPGTQHMQPSVDIPHPSATRRRHYAAAVTTRPAPVSLLNAYAPCLLIPPLLLQRSPYRTAQPSRPPDIAAPHATGP